MCTSVPIQDISDTVGHKCTHVTETVYRHVIVPEIRGGPTVMDDFFNDDEDDPDDRNVKSQAHLGIWLGTLNPNRNPENRWS
jgi:hypothetical protein